MHLKQSRFIVVSLNASLVKVAQVSASGVVERIDKKAVNGAGIDVALRQALTGFDTKHSSLICVVPGDVATTKSLEIPSADHDEIESILALQASRHTPFNKDEILSSYIKLTSPKPNFTQVLLVVVKREAVKDSLNIFKSIGFNAETVIFVPEAITRFYAKGLGAKKRDLSTAIIDVTSQSTNFIISAQGLPVMSRSIPVGIEHLAIDLDSGKRLADEIKASVDAFEQESGLGRPGKFLLTNNHVCMAGLDASLGAVLESQVEVLPYLNLVNASKVVKEALIKDFSDESALDVISAGVVAAKCQAALIPQEMKDQRAVAEKGKETLIAGVLLLTSLILVGVALISKVYFKDQFLKQNLIEQYSTQREEVQNLEKLIAKTKILRQYLEGRGLPLEAIRELYRIIPSQIYLTSVNLDDAGNLAIQGISDSMSQVFTFVTSLEDSVYFEGVKTKSTATKKDRNKDVAVFELVMKAGESGPVVSSQTVEDIAK